MDFSFFLLLYHHASQAIILNDNMKKALETTTDDFEAKLIQLVVDVNVKRVIKTYLAPLYYDKTVDFTWDLYITYPFILWDPLTQYQSVYKSNPIFCPLCLMQQTLYRPGKWFYGKESRSDPRVVFGTSTCMASQT